jgi:hypothetical protein
MEVLDCWNISCLRSFVLAVESDIDESIIVGFFPLILQYYLGG